MLIADLQYFGTIHFIQSLMIEKQICFDNNHAYSKMSFKNRTIIATAQGSLSLSIPIIGGRDQKIAIKDIKIDNQNAWRKQHFKALVSNYKRAPFFEYYETEIASLYDTEYLFLIDFLLQTNAWVKKQLKANWELVEIDTINAQRKFDPWLPKNYHQIANPVKYKQVFEDKIGFLPNLSILDLLFCVGGRQAHVLLMSN